MIGIQDRIDDAVQRGTTGFAGTGGAGVLDAHGASGRNGMRPSAPRYGAQRRRRGRAGMRTPLEERDRSTEIISPAAYFEKAVTGN
ncbi:hypothetical protein GCM10010126_62380 [Planomonospora parontospora]|uniref:Uncharacterized protein n=1 Tax=Planomonospora parontospora TaxID=58119 RepID=A0AA37BMY5_9ACTN|nr:hypothetical protein GCM10010126_62380 [Planomonospora parontospora]